MRDLLKWLKDFLNKPWLVLFFSVVVCFIVFYFEKMNFDNTITINDAIMLLTFFGLLWYAWETKKMSEASIGLLESQEKPVLCLYIRKINIDEGQLTYSIPLKENNNSGWALRIRNVGTGVALNVEIKSDGIEVQKYETKIYAPRNDEHSFRFREKDGGCFEKIEELNGKIFRITCNSISKKPYSFIYKINDVVGREVEYLGRS